MTDNIISLQGISKTYEDNTVLDDLYLEELSDNLIRTNRLIGLCDSDVEKAILKLNKKEN